VSLKLCFSAQDLAANVPLIDSGKLKIQIHKVILVAQQSLFFHLCIMYFYILSTRIKSFHSPGICAVRHQFGHSGAKNSSIRRQDNFSSSADVMCDLITPAALAHYILRQYGDT
jgi:hypothetical protein